MILGGEADGKIGADLDLSILKTSNVKNIISDHRIIFEAVHEKVNEI
jgi:hypothetical protein